MRKIISILIILMSVIGQKAWADDKHTADYIRQRIDSIYSHHGMADIDSTYCTLRYLELVRQAWDELAEGEILFDADHWINAQDWSKDFTAKAKDIDIQTDTTAIIKVGIHNFGRDYEVVLSLHYERDDWFVDDFLAADGGEGERAYLTQTICTILWRRIGLTDSGFQDVDVAKYCYVDIDGDGYDEIWLRSEDNRFGALVSLAGNAQLLVIERSPQRVVFYRGAVGVIGKAGYNSEISKVVTLCNSRKFHTVEYLATVPLELGTPIYEYYYDGHPISPVKGRQLMQRAKQKRSQPKPTWQNLPQEEDSAEVSGD